MFLTMLCNGPNPPSEAKITSSLKLVHKLLICLRFTPFHATIVTVKMFLGPQILIIKHASHVGLEVVEGPVCPVVWYAVCSS